MLGPGDFESVQVLDAWDETAAFRGVRVALPPALARAHERPGQLVKARTDAGETYFALASAPDPGATAELLVKRGGNIADALVAAAAPGRTVALTRPVRRGLPHGRGGGARRPALRGGLGDRPIRALVQHVMTHRNRYGRVTLFYGQRHRAEFAYRAEHMDWERRGVRVVLCPSGEDDAWQGLRGWVQEVARSLAFGGAPPGEAIAFVSGMTAMVEDVRRTLAAAGVPPERVHANF